MGNFHLCVHTRRVPVGSKSAAISPSFDESLDVIVGGVRRLKGKAVHCWFVFGVDDVAAVAQIYGMLRRVGGLSYTGAWASDRKNTRFVRAGLINQSIDPARHDKTITRASQVKLERTISRPSIPSLRSCECWGTDVFDVNKGSDVSTKILPRASRVPLNFRRLLRSQALHTENFLSVAGTFLENFPSFFFETCPVPFCQMLLSTRFAE